MATSAATNIATRAERGMEFNIDFDKKKLTQAAIDCQTRHQHLTTWLNNTIICAHHQAAWEHLAPQAILSLTWGDAPDSGEKRKKAIIEALKKPGHFRDATLMETMQQGLRKNNAPARLLLRAGLTPEPADQVLSVLDAFMGWRNSLPKQKISPLYQALITVYYLTIIQPMGMVQTAFNFVFLRQELEKLGFDVVGDYILEFYYHHEDIVADALASSYHARGKKFHQQHWFQLFFEAWSWALKQIEQDIQKFCFESCFNAHALTLLDNKTLNERQYQLLKQLQHEKSVRDKKALTLSVWYRVLYRDLTKRTQERDFNLLCEQGFVVMDGKNGFEVSST